MSDREDLWVNGYCFGSLRDAKEARNESQTIAYFKEKTRGRTAGNLLALYDKLLDEKVFKTPVGWEYLKQLQEEILKSDISPDQVRPITLYTGFTYRVQEDAQKAAMRQAEAIAQRKEKEGLPVPGFTVRQFPACGSGGRHVPDHSKKRQSQYPEL